MTDSVPSPQHPEPSTATVTTTLLVPDEQFSGGFSEWKRVFPRPRSRKMDDSPVILVVSSSATKPKSIIRLLTKENPKEQSDWVQQPWKIDTKYYTAMVQFVGVNRPTVVELGKRAEALVVHMDTNKATGLEDLERWHQLENDANPEVKLLLANYCNDDTKITKMAALKWCSVRGYELIELFPKEEADREENVTPETVGVNRVLEALQAHAWSNLVRKSVNSARLNSSETAQNADFLVEDDFTDLFTHLATMKDSLQGLPHAQRQHCAQQMVTAFWQAIEGDEDELLDV